MAYTAACAAPGGGRWRDRPAEKEDLPSIHEEQVALAPHHERGAPSTLGLVLHSAPVRADRKSTRRASRLGADLTHPPTDPHPPRSFVRRNSYITQSNSFTGICEFIYYCTGIAYSGVCIRVFKASSFNQLFKTALHLDIN
jgi:hypothetical protein